LNLLQATRRQKPTCGGDPEFEGRRVNSARN
jgi:hypothetical protein